jgi:hypothetical protein
MESEQFPHSLSDLCLFKTSFALWIWVSLTENKGDKLMCETYNIFSEGRCLYLRSFITGISQWREGILVDKFLITFWKFSISFYLAEIYLIFSIFQNIVVCDCPVHLYNYLIMLTYKPSTGRYFASFLHRLLLR